MLWRALGPQLSAALGTKDHGAALGTKDHSPAGELAAHRLLHRRRAALPRGRRRLGRRRPLLSLLLELALLLIALLPLSEREQPRIMPFQRRLRRSLAASEARISGRKAQPTERHGWLVAAFGWGARGGSIHLGHGALSVEVGAEGSSRTTHRMVVASVHKRRAQRGPTRTLA